AFEIKLLGSAAAELKALRVFDQRRVGGGIEKQLRDQPTEASRNRKWLPRVTPRFEHEPPILELRVGEVWGFFYVDEESQIVYIRAVREKAHGQTTEDIA